MSQFLKNFTILYVEDDHDTVESIQNILGDKVKELFIAYDGNDGIEVFKEKSPDIILTDIHMPKKNGIDMAQEIKKINPKQPIIILTAFNENSLLHKSVDIGIDGYVTKPIVDIEKMLEPLEKTAQRLQGNLDKIKLEHILEVQGKTAAVGEMIGNIAHQWRQPLSVISVNASSIKVKLSFDEELTKEELLTYSKEILNQTQYLSQTIDDFRSFLMADTTVKQTISFQNAFDEVYNLVQSTFLNHDIECIKNIEDISLTLNKNMLIQSILNICNNVKDAITLNDCKDRYCFINAFKKDGNIIISIKDSGGGIETHALDHLFEPYYTTKHQTKGTGIGLYITWKTIVKSFHGTISAQNVEFEYNGKKLKGAEFTITIPEILHP